jgi:hypothetical protein
MNILIIRYKKIKSIKNIDNDGLFKNYIIIHLNFQIFKFLNNSINKKINIINILKIIFIY